MSAYDRRAGGAIGKCAQVRIFADKTSSKTAKLDNSIFDAYFLILLVACKVLAIDLHPAGLEPATR